MKTIVSAVLVLMLCLGLAGCGEKTYTNDDLAIYDTQTKQLIRLGDSKENVEKILGKAEDELGNYCEYKDNLAVEYNISNNIQSVSIMSYGEYNSTRYENCPLE